jgi:protein-S-isoprenylcysteine O-methyltransferase Ste14
MTANKYNVSENRILRWVTAGMLTAGALAAAGVVWLSIAAFTEGDTTAPAWLVVAAVVLASLAVAVGTRNHSRAKKRWEAPQ